LPDVALPRWLAYRLVAAEWEQAAAEAAKEAEAQLEGLLEREGDERLATG